MIPGETLLTGAPLQCPDCRQKPVLGVYESAAGWYIGSLCGCGFYTRESHYYGDRKLAEADFKEGTWLPR